jgi:hypothetical protein
VLESEEQGEENGHAVLEAEEGGAAFGFLEEGKVGFEEEGCWDRMLEAALGEGDEGENWCIEVSKHTIIIIPNQTLLGRESFHQMIHTLTKRAFGRMLGSNGIGAIVWSAVDSDGHGMYILARYPV